MSNKLTSDIRAPKSKARLPVGLTAPPPMAESGPDPAAGSNYGYLAFPWVTRLHFLRVILTRCLMLGGFVIVMPTLLALVSQGHLFGSFIGHWLIKGIHPITWLAVMALSLALALHRPLRPRSRLAHGLIWLVLVMAFLRLVSGPVFPNLSNGFAELSHLMQPDSPPAMGANTAASLLLLAAALLTLRRMATVSIVLAALAPLPPLVALTGHLYGVEVIYGSMSLGSVAALLGLSICVLSMRAHHRLFRTVLSNGMLGRLVRLQLLIAAMVPLIAGRFLVEDTLDAGTEVVFVTLFSAVLASLVLLMMREHERAEFRRRLLERRLLALSVSDPLTGVASRRGAAFLTTRLLRAAATRGEVLSVLMIDIDHFKQVNDTWGHEIGDQVIVQAARLLEQRLRSTDGLVRWGGEEFVVVLPQTGLADAQKVAEALRALIADNLGQAVLPDGGRLTASLGCAELIVGEKSIAGAVGRADAALYRAKGAGRNQVAVARAEDETRPAPPHADGLARFEGSDALVS